MKFFVLLSIFASCTAMGMDTSTLQQLNTIIAQGSREAFDQNLEAFKPSLSYLDLQDAYNDCKRQLSLLKVEVSPARHWHGYPGTTARAINIIIAKGTFDEFKKYQTAFQKELHYNTIVEKQNVCASYLKAIDAKQGSVEHLVAEKHRLMNIQQRLQDILDAEWIPPGKLKHVKENDNYRFKSAQRKRRQ